MCCDPLKCTIYKNGAKQTHCASMPLGFWVSYCYNDIIFWYFECTKHYHWCGSVCKINMKQTNPNSTVILTVQLH